MNHELLKHHWDRADGRLRKVLYDVTRYRLERNECYLVGFLAAMYAWGLIERDDYHYWVAYSSNMNDEVLHLWENEK